MPKVTGTRDHKARDLFAKVQRGPASLNDTTGCNRADYNLWVSTWVLPQLIELIPQLRKDPPLFHHMNATQPSQKEPQPVAKRYDAMTVLELQKETIRRGLGLTNLRDYKRPELTEVLRADDRKEIETVQARYENARMKMDGPLFVIVDANDNLLSSRRDTPQEAWEEVAEDVRRLNREEARSANGDQS
jgi:hypothetical protein